MPPSGGDKEYKDVVQRIDKEDASVLKTLDDQLDEVRGQNHVLEAFKIKSDQLKEIHESLIEERKVVKKFDKLKFV